MCKKKDLHCFLSHNYFLILYSSLFNSLLFLQLFGFFQVLFTFSLQFPFRRQVASFFFQFIFSHFSLLFLQFFYFILFCSLLSIPYFSLYIWVSSNYFLLSINSFFCPQIVFFFFQFLLSPFFRLVDSMLLFYNFYTFYFQLSKID